MFTLRSNAPLGHRYLLCIGFVCQPNFIRSISNNHFKHDAARALMTVLFLRSVLPVIVPFSLSDKPAHTDQFLSLTCAISDGDEPLVIFWTWNNQPITPDMDVSIAKLGKRTSVLTIDSVGGHHAGQYVCHGKNAAGSTSHSTELRVIGVLLLCSTKSFTCFLA